MTVGTGIFLSALFLGVIALYIATKDRWNWRKIFVRPLFFLIGLALIIGLGTWAWNAYDDRPKIQTIYLDIAIGETVNNVRFKKGTPKDIDLGPDKGNPVYKYEIDEATGAHVRFVDGKVRAVYAWSSRNYSHAIQNIYFDSSAEEIIRKFGPGAVMEESKDAIRRVYAFPKYQVFFFLDQNKVRVMGTYNPAYPLPIQPTPRDEK